MDIILTEDVRNLGEMGEIVKVAPGYGRNYLIPQGFALPATTSNRSELAHRVAEIERLKAAQQAEARKIVGEIDGVSITIPKRAGEEDKLFGSVTAREVADVLSAQGVKVEKKQVELHRHINELGIYRVGIKLASGVFAYVRVWVVAM